jgi:hypothetical protein
METKRSSLIFGILALLLAATTAFFGFKYSQEKTAAEQYLAEQLAISEQYDQLTEDFNQLTEEFEAIKAENAELDSELQAKIAEIEAEKERVASMIRRGGRELNEAKALIAELQSEKEELLAAIEVLKEENAALQAEKEALAMDLAEEKKKNEELTEDNRVLTVNLEEVTEERDELIPIANYGQVIEVNEVEAQAVRVKKNGKEKKARSKSAEKLKLCFQMEENPVAEIGEQDYLIRIITPEGSTLYQEESGSGTFTSLESGTELKYTSEAVVDFRNEVKNVCWYWGQTTEYQKGEYTAEVYHRGYKVGTEKFSL